MRTEADIRLRLAELDSRQKGWSWSGSPRAVHAKIALRAQMKGLLFALGEEAGFKITED